MDFTEINYAAFAARIAWINQRLANPKHAQELLTAARQDMPIIEPLLSAMNALSEAPESPTDKRLLAKAQRDVEDFLTIWHVLRQPEVVTDECSSRQRGHIYGYEFPRFLFC